MKKYKVLKNLPKSIVNANRFITLKKGQTIRLRYGAKVKVLIRQGFLKESIEFTKRKISKPTKPASPVISFKEDKEEYSKKNKKHKSKANKFKDIALEDEAKETE